MNKYDSYNDSGVEWLGKIPTHWSTSFIKNLVEIKITDGPHLTPNFVDEGGIPFLSVESIQNSKIDLSRRRGNISVEDHFEYSKKCKPQWNDILLVKSGSVGKLTIVDIEDEFNVWSPLSLIRIKKKGNPKYFYYFFHTDYFQTLLKLNSGINTQPNIGMGVIENLKVVSPPLSEQQQIVEFLDTKTELIDSLIEKTERKIELLKEKRTSLINETVTKGLDPNVEMKDSGVEWIGKIPSHWSSIPLKYFLEKNKDSIRTGPFGSTLKSSDMIESGIRIYNQRTVYDEDFSSGKIFVSDEKYQTMKSFTVLNGDILISSRGTIGKMTIVPEGSDIGVLHPCLIRLRIDQKKMNKQFLWWYMNQSSLFLQSVKFESNSTTIDVIYSNVLSEVKFSVPTLSEQEEIISFLSQKIGVLDKTISNEEKRIELLKEYRQSLISEVVTGKRKVTNG